MTEAWPAFQKEGARSHLPFTEGPRQIPLVRFSEVFGDLEVLGLVLDQRASSTRGCSTAATAFGDFVEPQHGHCAMLPSRTGVFASPKLSLKNIKIFIFTFSY
jgi:hypothetical protein